MTDEPDVETVERVIAAPPEAIFELLVDPRRHRDIDGSGTVRDAKGEPERLELGSKFGMSMKMGLPYSMVSTVVEYDARTGASRGRPGGRPRSVGTWPGASGATSSSPSRAALACARAGTSRTSPQLTKPLVRKGADATRKNMAATLERIEELVTDVELEGAHRRWHHHAGGVAERHHHPGAAAGLAAAVTWPPMASTSSRTIASPSPDPTPCGRAAIGHVQPLEHVRQVLGRDAGAVVADLDAHARALLDVP